MASLTVSLRIEEPGWKKALKSPSVLLAKAAKAAVKAGAADLPGKADIAILLSNDKEMAALNKMWRGKAGPTNVLSFPALPEASPPGGPVFLGDLVMALETVMREAVDQGKSIEAHMAHLTIHGVLHLLGFDHMDAKEARAMERLEKEIMKELGYSDPYKDGK
jgi:probable rRNA maturation factor